MSILTKTAINKEIKEGNLVFDPPISPDQVREASVDLRLGDVFRIYEKTNQPIEIKEDCDYKDYTKEIKTKTLFLAPSETVLGVTVETVDMPSNLCGWLEGRSRFARLGLLIHISAGLIQPGVKNKQVLEITNLSPNILVLHAGERVCQLAFERTEGTEEYKGKFQGQEKP